jgi:hypothetical protein
MLGHDGFYTKYATYKGLPFLASKNVDDKALHKLVYGIGRMLEKVPEAWIEAFVASGSFFAIIGKNEGHHSQHRPSGRRAQRDLQPRATQGVRPRAVRAHRTLVRRQPLAVRGQVQHEPEAGDAITQRYSRQK